MRISATLLETFRLWQTEDWLTTERLIADIKGERDEPTGKMRLGSAFEAVIEHPSRYRDLLGGSYACDGYLFSADDIRSALDLQHPNAVRQVKSTAQIAGHTLVAKCDQVYGSAIIENKTTLGTFDADKYERSMQWRAMLAVFGAASVEYRVFLLSGDEDGGPIALKDTAQCWFYPYPGLKADVAGMVTALAAFVDSQGLTRYLEREGSLVV